MQVVAGKTSKVFILGDFFMKAITKSLLTLVLALSAVGGFSQQRTERITASPMPPHVCPDFRLEIGEIRQLHAWLEGAQVIPAKAIQDMKYRIDANGGKKERPRPYYPLFVFWDGEDLNTARIWNPIDEGFPSLLPEAVDWASDCR